MQPDFEQFADEVSQGLSEWDPPIPLGQARILEFPTRKLPGAVSLMVEALAESTQTPPEMAGLLSLGVLASALQGRFSVQVRRDWNEPLCLFCCAVAPPAERKSAVLGALTDPIREYERQRRALEAPDLARNESERKILEGLKAAAETATVKGKPGEREDKRLEALDLAAQLAEFKVMHEYRLLADDSTPEKLADLMAGQNGCLTVASAEGGIFDSMRGRYDRLPNFDLYLHAHAGEPVSVDRIGRKSVHIDRARLTMLLAVQPSVLSEVLRNRTFRGRGLCARFLFAVCRSRVGSRKVEPDPVPDDVKEAYRSFVHQILGSRWSGIIMMSTEADRLRAEYQQYIERKLSGEWEFMQDWGGKLVGAMARIAALLHCADAAGDPAETPISARTLSNAISIAECLSAHAATAFQGTSCEVEDARYLLKRIAALGGNSIKKRDLFAACRPHFQKAEAMEPGLQVLKDHGYIREESRSTGGRPSVLIAVNPLWR